MALTEARGQFSFTWRIENFSMCPQKYEERLESPVFVVDMLQKSEWRLFLYPRGRKTENFISYIIAYTGTGIHTGDQTIEFELVICSLDLPMQVTHKQSLPFKASTCGINDQMISRNAIFVSKDAYLPNDTLTLKCKMRRKKDPKNSETDALGAICPDQSTFGTALSREMFSSVARDDLLDFRTQFGSNRASIRTTIRVRKRTVTWPIRNFSSLRINQRLSIPFLSSLVGVPSFFLTFYLSGSSDSDRCGHVEIRRNKTDCSGQTFVKCKISVLNTLKNYQYFAEENHFFEPKVTDDIWKFPSFVNLSKLKDDKYFQTTHDTLLLRCELAFSELGNFYNNVDVAIITHAVQSASFSNTPDSLENGIQNFYRDGEFSDLIVRAADRVFKVHKIILSARSSVFRAMFNHDMKETETGVVDITDLSPATVDRMLAFFYTDALEDLNPNDALELYSAADKYQVLSLKLRCSSILRSTLSVSNVCDVLSLADLHHDEDLWNAVQSFINTNSHETFQSPEWKRFMKNNISLAADVMYKLLSKPVA